MMMSSASSRRFLASSMGRRAVLSSRKSNNSNNSNNNRMQFHRSLQTSKSTKSSTASNTSNATNTATAKRIHSSAKKSQSTTTSVVDYVQRSSTNLPTSNQLYTLFIASAIPMCAFGFMDNVIMIQAGGYIDATFGATLGLATLSAAALGQVVSDVSGVVFGSTVEGLLLKYNIMPTTTVKMSEAQRQLPHVRRVAMMGSVAGMVVGCLLGASSLLFVDLHAHENQKRTAELKDVLQTMLHQDESLGACRVYLSQANATAFALADNEGQQQIRFMENDNDSSPVAQCARDQQVIFDDDHCMYVPIVAKGATLGVLEFQNCSSSDTAAVIVARHIGIFMDRLASRN